MENENINTNATDTQMNSTNESKSESFANEALTANTNYGTISSADIENGTAELVLIPPFEGDDGGISVACVEGDDSSCNMASQTDRDNATLLTLDQWKCDSITDTVSERWYKFHISEDATYTIYTTGSTNTTGRLYDHDGNFVTMNDDRAGSLNFRIVYPLSVDSYESDSGWYYVKVTTPQTETGEFHIRVIKRVLVSKVTVSDANITLDIGETYTLSASVYPDNADNKRISFSSYNTDVATIDPDTGVITALSPGIANICAFDWNNDGEPGRCEVWVRGKKPVILLHGRIDNTRSVWGAENDVCGCNNGYDSEDEALVPGKTLRYIDVTMQEIKDIRSEQHSEGGYLAHYLTSADEQGNNRGYIKNANLFAFNYPNEDAVVHSAEKLKLYIDNLIDYARTSGSDTMKACFFRSRADCVNNNYNKIDIVAHSLGGLVARYYIENLGYDNNVDKLITVCTPHWGTGFADGSNIAGDLFYEQHVLCDHDISPNSVMFGFDDVVPTNLCYQGCPNHYPLTDELHFSTPHTSKYYAIAGIDYPHAVFERNNENSFVVPKDKQTYNSLGIFLATKGVMNLVGNILPLSVSAIEELADLNEVGRLNDNVVGFLSQIGWTGDGIADLGNLFAPNKKVPMEEIFVCADTDGGNSLIEFSLLHNKIPHRESVIERIALYLNQ